MSTFGLCPTFPISHKTSQSLNSFPSQAHCLQPGHTDNHLKSPEPIHSSLITTPLSIRNNLRSILRNNDYEYQSGESDQINGMLSQYSNYGGHQESYLGKRTSFQITHEDFHGSHVLLTPAKPTSRLLTPSRKDG